MSRIVCSTDVQSALRSRQRGFLLNPFRFGGGGSNSYEDFTSYNEVDPNSKITKTSSTASFSGLSTSSTSYLYTDFGAGHFSANFSIDFDVRVSSFDNFALLAFCLLSNEIGNIGAISNRIHVDFYNSSSNTSIRIIEKYSGSSYLQSYVVALNTTYYCRVVRDESVGSFGAAYLYIASSNANRQASTWITTLTLSLHAKQDFRYLYFLNTFGSSGTPLSSGYVENALINYP